MENKIDFILPWVDGGDPEWKKLFNQYLPYSKKTDDAREVRYRDWDNLRYWFRGIEKFAPWVNKVHFITNGQIPDWLNLDAPRLNYVKHSDYIPQEYLPTFSANPIEVNIHRIEGLAEQFVYFNDDFFLIDKIEPTRFFHNGLPCDMAVFSSISPGGIAHIVLNDLEVINSQFDKRNTLRKNFFKWINYKYGVKILRTCALWAWPKFTGFYEPHLPNAYLKSTFKEVWSKYGEILKMTSANKFRDISDVNQYLFRYWQLVEGHFYPCNINKDSIYFEIFDHTLGDIVEAIQMQKKKIIILNDGEVSSFEIAKERINAAFDKILPDKSSFEL